MQWLHLQEFLSMINIEGTAISLQISPQNLTLVLPVKCLRYILHRINHHVIPFKQIQNGLYDHDMRSHQFHSCSVHDDPLEFFCEQCEVTICGKCKASEHDSHKCTRLDDALPRYKRHINGLLEGINGQIPNIADYVKYLQAYCKSVEESKHTLMSDLENQANTLHTIIFVYSINLHIEELGKTECYLFMQG
jgi:hypothetical protein